MVLKVGMADLKVTTKPDSLKTLGLGSCIGVCIYDPTQGVGGMVHVMLPRMADYRDKTNMAKYADTGIERLIAELRLRKANLGRLEAKIAGGAQMFSFSGKNPMMRIGERNASAVKDVLAELSIPISAEDTGGNYGRTIEFFLETGDLKISSIGKGIKVI